MHIFVSMRVLVRCIFFSFVLFFYVCTSSERLCRGIIRILYVSIFVLFSLHEVCWYIYYYCLFLFKEFLRYYLYIKYMIPPPPPKKGIMFTFYFVAQIRNLSFLIKAACTYVFKHMKFLIFSICLLLFNKPIIKERCFALHSLLIA